MRTWCTNKQVSMGLDKDDVMCLAAMLEPIQVQMKKAVVAMDYAEIKKLVAKAEEIKKAIILLQEGDKDESCGTDGKNN